MILRRVVVVSNELEIQKTARNVGQEIFVADDTEEAIDITETVSPDMIIFNSSVQPSNVDTFRNAVCRNLPIIVSGTNPDLSDAFQKAGAIEYIEKTQLETRLPLVAEQIKNNARLNDSEKTADRFFINEIAHSSSIVGHSRATKDKLQKIRMVAESMCNPVLIVGETGTGKEHAAKAVHLIRHPEKPFVAVNCAALTANLLESELFGHVKGAFTGADREKTGLMELAGAGTVLLDEISEMPMDLQAKLLRVLQEKTFRKVGGLKDIECMATIIASSNCNLRKEVEKNNFRRDLYYRLNVFPITIAPLRNPDRKEDISLLTEYFLKTSQICPEKTEKISSITNMALERLENHQWSGNVRELRNVIDRAILLETTDKIGMNSIVLETDEYTEAEPENRTVSENCKDFSLEKAERELIARALKETGWQKTRAAGLLGITRATLYAKVKQYKIEKGREITPAKEAVIA